VLRQAHEIEASSQLKHVRYEIRGKLARRAHELERQGYEIIQLNIGNPGLFGLRTPETMRLAMIENLPSAEAYCNQKGIFPAREAVVMQQQARGIDGVDADHVFMGNGVSELIDLTLRGLLNPGDEVLIPSPYWVSYPEQVRLLGGVPVPVITQEAGGFDLDPDALRRAVTPRTKMVVLDSPGNPTGAVFSPDALAKVARLAVERDLWIVSDECYESLTYEGRHVSIAGLSAEVKARTIVVNTCSKAYAMTGWRIGYAAGPKPVIKAMTDVQSQVTSNPTSVAQWAAVEALGGPQDEVAKMAGEFDRRRRVIIEALNAIPGVTCVMPKGAFYAFPNVSGLFGKRAKAGVLRSSADVCAFLLDEARIATVAGVDFGSDAHIRLSYATGLDTIKEGLRRMAAAVRTLEG
jgi:aspartate aminotransferase